MLNVLDDFCIAKEMRVKNYFQNKKSAIKGVMWEADVVDDKVLSMKLTIFFESGFEGDSKLHKETKVGVEVEKNILDALGCIECTYIGKLELLCIFNDYPISTVLDLDNSFLSYNINSGKWTSSIRGL